MRAALQFLMRHMVKRAVMRSPIKRALGLADLERAQAMIYKLVVNGLLEDPSGGKAKPGENMQKYNESRLFVCARGVPVLINNHFFSVVCLFMSLRSEK